MKPFVIELNDRAVALARDGEVLVSAPSAVFDGSGVDGTGAGAPGKSAWHALRRQPRSTSSRHLSAMIGQSTGVSSTRTSALVAAELSQHLAAYPPRADERVWVAVPVRADADGLGSVLGISQTLGIAIDGFVDAATVSVAALGTARSALVLELGLHHAAVTAVDSGAQARRRRAVSSDVGGLVELYETWLTFISTAMVKRTRFDPFTNADTEQQLFDALPALTRQAAETGGTNAAVSNGDNRFEVSLSRDQFAAAAQPIYRELVRLLHSLRPAGVQVSIVMPEAVAALPGLHEMLEQFVGCEVIAVPEGFAAAAASLLDLPEATPGGAVRLLRRLPVKEQAALATKVKREVLGRSGARAAPPTHVLFEGRAYALGATPLVVGRSPVAASLSALAATGASGAAGAASSAGFIGSAASAPSAPSSASVAQVSGAPYASALTLPDGLAGVSRRHCTFVRDGDELVLVDHSHFGTVVNGERVSERVRIHAGDKVRLGEPGVELSLISIGT
ncbi:MAG: FHA domain-containing protein [Gammaproteobacteria bacterium]